MKVKKDSLWPLPFMFVISLVILYLTTASAVYRFRNPHMTETELFLNLPRAWMWNND